MYAWSNQSSKLCIFLFDANVVGRWPWWEYKRSHGGDQLSCWLEMFSLTLTSATALGQVHFWGLCQFGMTEDEMAGLHHQLNGPEFEQAAGDNEGQGSLGCCSPWGCKEWNMTEGLNNSKSEKLAQSDLTDDKGNLLLIVRIAKISRSRLPSGKTWSRKKKKKQTWCSGP